VKNEESAVLELHNSLLDELRASGQLHGDFRGTVPLVERGKILTVADAPSRAVVVNADGERYAVMFVSTTVDSGYVARNVASAAAAKRALGEDIGSVILDPIASGEFRGLSFVLWPWHRAITSIRGLAYLQRRILLPRVLGWLRDATQYTARAAVGGEIQTAFAKPLARIAQDERMPPAARASAREGIQRLGSGAWRPRVVLQHKDFGHWNILLPRDKAHRRQFPRGFILIDWSGANLRGYPFSNLLTRARTSRMPARVLRSEMVQHCNILNCEVRDIMPNVLAGLGFVGEHLGHFSETDYIWQCHETIRFSETVIRALA
jgi:hypothetical protein